MRRENDCITLSSFANTPARRRSGHHAADPQTLRIPLPLRRGRTCSLVTRPSAAPSSVLTSARDCAALATDRGRCSWDRTPALNHRSSCYASVESDVPSASVIAWGAQVPRPSVRVEHGGRVEICYARFWVPGFCLRETGEDTRLPPRGRIFAQELGRRTAEPAGTERLGDYLRRGGDALRDGLHRVTGHCANYVWTTTQQIHQILLSSQALHRGRTCPSSRSKTPRQPRWASFPCSVLTDSDNVAEGGSLVPRQRASYPSMRKGMVRDTSAPGTRMWRELGFARAHTNEQRANYVSQ